MRQRTTAVATALVALAAAGGAGCGGHASSGAAKQAGGTQVAAVAVRGSRSPVGDPEAAQSYATPQGVKLTHRAPAPGAATAGAAEAKPQSDAQASHSISPGAPSDAEIARELLQMKAAQRQQSALGGIGRGIQLRPDGTAKVSSDAPAVIARLVAGANAIAKFPYVFGGGHSSFVDTAYDCSGSLSYALAAGGLLKSPKTSGELARAGAKGPGRWITIYANAGHTFMDVDGLRYDTSGRGGPKGTRWQVTPRSTAGFTARHPPGL